MNILFFLTPKNDVAFIYSDANLREAIDLMEAHGYSALPILTKQGRYAGTLTEGDLLWGMKTLNVPNLKASEPEFKGYGADLRHGGKAPSGQQPGKRRSKDGRSAG